MFSKLLYWIAIERIDVPIFTAAFLPGSLITWLTTLAMHLAIVLALLELSNYIQPQQYATHSFIYLPVFNDHTIEIVVEFIGKQCQSKLISINFSVNLLGKKETN